MTISKSIQDTALSNIKRGHFKDLPHWESVQDRLVQLAYDQLPRLSISNAVGTSIIVAIMWDHVPQMLMFIWLAGVALTVIFATTALLLLFRRVKSSQWNSTLWGQRVTILGFIRALAWGSAGFLLFVPDSIELQILMGALLMGGASLTTMQTVSYKPAFYAACLPILLPYALRNFYEGDAFHIGIGVAILFYLIALIYLYQKIHGSLVQSLLLQFELDEMAQRLSKEKIIAEQANIAKSRFLASASHDLRQPLHAQGLFVESLRQYVHGSEARTVLDHLECSIDAMRSLFGALLDISKLDANIIQPNIKNFPIQPLLDEVTRDFSSQALEKGLKFHTVDSTACLISDRALLTRILRNLIANAIKYTEDGGVLVGCRRSGNNIRIEVRDTGLGIPKDQIHSVFQEFYQLHNPERDRQKGLGLGLAIVDRLARLLDHSIHISSEYGKGSIFTVTAPRGSLDLEQAAEKALSSISTNDMTGVAVLFIDDEATIRDGMHNLLTQWGCHVLTAGSLNEALRDLKDWRHSLDIIIADYRLRDNKTGVQAINYIQSTLNLQLPAIIITGDLAPDRLREAKASGYELLHKPVTPLKLLNTLSHLIWEQT